MKQTLALIAALALAVLLAAAYWLNRVAIDLALTEIFGALFAGIKILFFTGLVLGIAWCAIELRRHSQVKVIGPTKHGPVQAFIHNGEVHQLQLPGQAQMDPLQQLQYMQKFFQIQGPMQKYVQAQVQEMAPLQQIAGPSQQQGQPEQERIAEVIRYEDVADQVAADMSLLGIHPANGDLEIVAPSSLKTVWFVGGSNTGKTNTVFGKVGDCVRWGCKISICDQHAYKTDSLAGKMQPYERAFLHKPVYSDDAIKQAILTFLEEFHRRRKGGKYTDKWLIVVDEVNGLCEHVVRVTREEAEMIYERYGVEIKKERIKMRVFIQLLVETCGYESRGFEMFGFFISQKAADLFWLRKAAMTVIVHGLLMKSEALLACNDNAEAAAMVMNFKKGRTYIYGYEVERPLELQQPLYDENAVESTTSKSTSKVEEVPTSEANERVVYFSDHLKQREVPKTDEEGQAQNTELTDRCARVAQLMAEGKSVNKILELEWGIVNPGGKYQAALVELREVQQIIARRAIG